MICGLVCVRYVDQYVNDMWTNMWMICGLVRARQLLIQVNDSVKSLLYVD